MQIHYDCTVQYSTVRTVCQVATSHLEEPLPLELELPENMFRLELARLVVHSSDYDSCPHSWVDPWVMSVVVVPMFVLFVFVLLAMVVYHHCCPCSGYA